MHVLPESITALALDNPVVHAYAKQHQAGMITAEAAIEGMVLALAEAADRLQAALGEVQLMRPMEILVPYDSLPHDVQAKVRGNVRLVAPLADPQ